MVNAPPDPFQLLSISISISITLSSFVQRSCNLPQNLCVGSPAPFYIWASQAYVEFSNIPFEYLMNF